MLQLNYKLTDEDYIEFNEFHQLIHSEVGKRNLFKLRLIGPMISILAIVIFILARAEIMLIVTEVIVLCIFSIVCVTQAKKIMKRGIRKTILKMKETEGETCECIFFLLWITICRRNNIKFYGRSDHRDNKRSGSESRL